MTHTTIKHNRTNYQVRHENCLVEYREKEGRTVGIGYEMGMSSRSTTHARAMATPEWLRWRRPMGVRTRFIRRTLRFGNDAWCSAGLSGFWITGIRRL
jgi:hypothetical protein